MFSHVQLTPEGKFLRKIPAGELIAWDDNNYCTAFALERDGKAEQFQIHKYYSAGKPAYNPIMQTIREVDPVLVNGLWTQQWELVALDTDTIAANIVSDRAAKWEVIKSERDRRSQYGGYKAAGKWFHSDTFSRSQQIGLVIMGANIPAGLQWKTMDGSFIEMTPALAQQVFQAAATQDGAIFAHAEALRLDVETSPNPAAVDITSGWPETFGGV